MSETQPETEDQVLDPFGWVDRHGGYLCRYAWYRLRDRDTAEAVVQETFMAALNAQSHFQRKGSERSRLLGILKHKIIDCFRRSNQEQPSSDDKVMKDLTESFFDDRNRGKDHAVMQGSDTIDFRIHGPQAAFHAAHRTGDTS
jgi:DNA-directed RNA polymerase specialized sigma24 family protein